ncbi:MAG TPA: hypothetical protein VFV58_15235 [Blastocatellia bacterium]|nr:hypothetical protein [Blastocatellia bacterium]
MKRVSIIITIVLIALGGASQAPSFAQQKQRQKKPTRGAKPTPTPTPDTRAEASKVAAQIKKVSNFIYIYGKVVNGLEFANEQAKDDPASPKAQALNKENKDKLIASIAGLRAEVEDLSKGFEGNPRLQVQYLKLSYATDASLDAERFAAAGRYDEAGKSLVTVVERLTDTIISMRLP